MSCALGAAAAPAPRASTRAPRVNRDLTRSRATTQGHGGRASCAAGSARGSRVSSAPRVVSGIARRSRVSARRGRRTFAKPDDDVVAATLDELKQLFPADMEDAKLLKSAVVRTPRSVYAAIPGRNKYRPSQKTPIPNLTLAGCYTSQKFLGSMEGAVLAGKLAAEVVAAPGLKDRLGSVGNQFALTTILAFLMSIPVVVLKGEPWSGFVQLWKTNPVVRLNVIASGLFFYGYNELATMTIKKTSAVTQSVANTAKRVIIIVVSSIIFVEPMERNTVMGSAIAICGTFGYSLASKAKGGTKKKKA